MTLYLESRNIYIDIKQNYTLMSITIIFVYIFISNVPNVSDRIMDDGLFLSRTEAILSKS